MQERNLSCVNLFQLIAIYYSYSPVSTYCYLLQLHSTAQLELLNETVE